MRERRPPAPRPSLGCACAGELVGTYLLAFFGCGSVLSAVITGAQVGLWQVAVVWGFGISLAIYATAAASGAHLNPAVTLSVALRRHETFPPSRVLPYWAAQLAGAFLAAATLYACFSPFIARFEALHHLVRGQPGSQLSAMIFGEYGPNPAVFGTAPTTVALLSPVAVMLIEALGTAILLFFIFALVDRRNRDAPGAHLAPFFIGFSVAIIISVLAPLTQAGLNPARDLGPRLFALLAGWGAIALPGPNGLWWAYIVGPVLGGPLGATLYDLLIRTTPPSEERAVVYEETAVP
ncbi:MAG TPA: MIP/aquaporin family protein [Chloroflexota bacterium]|nr:MIP/aquaporin family protein [Chloroflexota bacterium]